MQSSVSGDVIVSPSVRQKDRMFPSDERNLLRDATRELLITTCAQDCPMESLFDVKPSNINNVVEKVIDDIEYITFSINLLNTNGAFGIIEVCTSFALFAACGLKNRFFVLPHVVLHVILLGYTLGVVLYFIFTGNLTDVVVPLIITWLLPNYLLIVVYSFYESLREDPSGVNAGYFPDNPTVAAPNANCTTMEALKQPIVKSDRIPGLWKEESIRIEENDGTFG
ncbi:uncharacterized protein LOC114977285 [Acropora millepora]|uniref:uncharacterized protein LOC114977285 n=1 Tax=Acropora millepora TaxID=45264 RepID=UPI001CF4B16C|nr:uncharacterized protein LOC114977285 [Acropora millepora]